MRFKLHLTALAALALALAVFLGGRPALAQEKKPVKARYTWRIATVVPGGMGWSKRAKEILVPYIARFTGGDLDVRIFWGGIKGDDDAILKQVRRGELEGGGFSGYGTVAACREFSVLTLPFIFKSWDEVDHIRHTMYPVFDRLVENRGLRLILWADQDFDQIYSTRYDLSTLADMRKARFLRWYGDVEGLLFSTLGVNSRPARIPDVNRAISEDDVDAAIAPSMWVLGAQIFPFIKYVLPIKIRYSPVAVMVSEKTWRSVPEKYRAGYLKERESITRDFIDYSRKDSERCTRAMIAYGIVEARMSPKEEAQLEAIARTVWNRAAGDLYPKSLLDEVLARLNQYRKART